MTFSTFSFEPRVFAGIPSDYLIPTPIQAQAIPLVLQGKDVLGLAQTGTGKTAAFVLPILNRLIKGKRGTVRTLIIAPTRELVEQICESIRTLGAHTGLKCTAIYGGVNMNGQVQRLRQGVEIVVACPRRLLDHMQQRTIDLRALEVLVLDEADQMFDMGFLPGIRRILKAIPSERQTLLFSATMPSDIRHLAHEVLKNPETVQVGDRAPVATVSHAIYLVEQQQKTALLLEVLKHTDTGSVLIFTRTKHRAKRLGLVLKREGFHAASLQGNMSQRQRQDALDGFRDGRFQILVATDIAARGLDIERVSHVINYDIPGTVEAYTHRIGRTGRAERLGDAFTFVAREDSSMVRAIERVLGAPIERRQTPAGLQTESGTTNLDHRPAQEHQQRRQPSQRNRRPRRFNGAPSNVAA